MLKNAYLDATIGVDPAENEPRKEWCAVASALVGLLSGDMQKRQGNGANLEVARALAEAIRLNLRWV